MRIAIDHDRAHPVEHHTRILESDAVCICGAPGREHNETCSYCGPFVECYAHTSVFVPLDPADKGFEARIDSALPQCRRQCDAQIVVESAQRLLSPMDHSDLRAQTMADPGNLK